MWESIPTAGRITDPDLLAFFERRVQRTAEEFELDREGWPSEARLHWHDGPPRRSIIPGDPSGCLIYLRRGIDWPHACFQLAHETTHSVLCPNHVVFEWVQEMFAIHVSLRALLEIDAGDYAEAAIEQFLREDQEASLTTAEMMEADLEQGYPPGLYPRAFLVGCELIEGVGWERVRPLGGLFDSRGKHDMSAWVETLDLDEAKVVQQILEL
ncbi:MAG TPA: hypothetical protein VFK14_04775 [Solirubrobacterales bacterium]|nr:hypothetical protein [Solirubrobacterales bacterium]